jgi:hypothetical protein
MIHDTTLWLKEPCRLLQVTCRVDKACRRPFKVLTGSLRMLPLSVSPLAHAPTNMQLLTSDAGISCAITQPSVAARFCVSLRLHTRIYPPPSRTRYNHAPTHSPRLFQSLETHHHPTMPVMKHIQYKGVAISSYTAVYPA